MEINLLFNNLDHDSLVGEMCDSLPNRSGKILEIASKKSIDEAALEIPVNDDDGVESAFPAFLWPSLKKEIFLFVCEDCEKYRSIKEKLANSGDISQKVLIATLASILSSAVGRSVALCSPFCILGLLTVARLGREAFCASSDWGQLNISE